MTLQLSVPKDLTEAIGDLRDSVVQNTDLLTQLIAKQPAGNGDEAAPKKKPVSLHEPIKKAFKVMVECKVIFLKIGEIETLKEQYNAEVYVQAMPSQSDCIFTWLLVVLILAQSEFVYMIHSCIHLFIHSIIHLYIDSLIRPFVLSFVLSSIRSFI